jgi:predicted secreted protein
MNLGTGIAVYVVLWWVVLFAVLPWGVHVPDRQENPAYAASAPERPRMLLKAAVTTVIAAVLWLGVEWLATTDLITFRGP